MSDLIEQLRAVAASALQPVEGELNAPGLREPVEVLRDTWGVPYISAASLDDLWFAQGFVTAGERLFQMDLALRAANGRLSEIFADRTLADDRFARVVGFNQTGAKIAAAYDDDSRAMVTRFVEGAFAWIEQMPSKPVEYVLLDIEPGLPRDEASWAATAVYLAWQLSGNANEELLRARIAEELGPDAVGRLMPPLPADDPAIAAGALAGRLLDAMPPKRGGLGSNDWVVDGSMTTTGKPLLANDPHLEATQPGAWLEMGLRAPGYEARGVAFPFAPGIILGATPHHAWGVTNVTGDVQDLYLERLNEDRTAALHDDEWEQLIVHHEEIAVRGSNDPVLVDVLVTRHGPILECFVVGEGEVDYVPLSETYALRWTGHDRTISPSGFVRAAQARNFGEFREAVFTVECPGQNFVYADVEGNIGYQCTGAFPIRRSGDGTAPVPGWTDEHEWDGYIPASELPWAENPDRGFLVTANNRMHGPDYPHLIGSDFHTPFRARRITERLRDETPHDVDSFARIQIDTVSLAARELLPKLASVEPRTDRQRDALELLTAWNADMAADSAPASLYNAWIAEIAHSMLGEHPFFDHYIAARETFVCLALPLIPLEPDLLLATLDRALATSPGPWGQMHTLKLTHPLGRMPGLEPLFVAAEFPAGGDEQTILQGGFDAREGFSPAVIPSWRAVWDLSDLDNSVTVLPAGVSGNPASPHWNDQSTLYAAGRTHPAPVSRPAVETAAVSALRLLPG